MYPSAPVCLFALLHAHSSPNTNAIEYAKHSLQKVCQAHNIGSVSNTLRLEVCLAQKIVSVSTTLPPGVCLAQKIVCVFTTLPPEVCLAHKIVSVSTTLTPEICLAHKIVSVSTTLTPEVSLAHKTVSVPPHYLQRCAQHRKSMCSPHYLHAEVCLAHYNLLVFLPYHQMALCFHTASLVILT